MVDCLFDARLSTRTNPLVSDAKKTEGEKAEEADAELLAAIARTRKLASDLELAKGIHYTKSIETSYVLEPLPFSLILYSCIAFNALVGHLQNIFENDRRSNITSYAKSTI